MRTFNDIATDMRVLAKEIGGGHVKSKEAEKQLIDLADELSNKSYILGSKIYSLNKGFGCSEEYLKDVKLALMREKQEVKTDKEYLQNVMLTLMRGEGEVKTNGDV